MIGQIENCAYHSEISALRQVDNPKGAIIYNARVNRQGETRLAKPCDACQEAIEEAGVKRVVWTN